MKFLKYLLSAITAIVLISACQKELNFETDGLAHGSLKSDVTGDCLPSTVNGIYKADSLLDINNFVDIQVDLTSTGTYDIKSDTINGYSFQGTGTLGIAGINTVRLYATGKPVLSQTDVFTIKFDSTICFVNVTVIGAGTGIAVYTLEATGGICTSNVNGIYTQGTALDVTNTVSLTVNVTATGIYTFGTTSPVNGMMFVAAGVFTTLGQQTVTLNGAGIPVTAGVSTIPVTNLSSNCSFDIDVFPSGTGGPAVYTLNATAGACSGASYSGTFIAGIALTSMEAVLINATVTSIGTYTITTNTVNGMTFSGSGSFTNTGSQPVVLTGSGTPAASGIFNFTATAGTSTCTFSVTVDPNTSINLDYVPETTFSNWSQRLVGGTASDTAYIQVSPNTTVINTIAYKIFEVKDLGTPVDSFYHRKNGGKYYQLYKDSYIFDSPFSVDGLLLDSTLATGASWLTNLGSNTISGAPATGLIECLMIDKGATATIAGITYTNVIKMTYTFNYNLGAGNIVFGLEEVWYAKGNGIIYDSISDIPTTFTDVIETTRIQIF